MHGVVGSGASVHYGGPTVIRSVTCALRERAKEVSKLWLSGVTVSGSGMHAIEIAMLASEEWLILNLAFESHWPGLRWGGSPQFGSRNTMYRLGGGARRPLPLFSSGCDGNIPLGDASRPVIMHNFSTNSKAPLGRMR